MIVIVCLILLGWLWVLLYGGRIRVENEEMGFSSWVHGLWGLFV